MADFDLDSYFSQRLGLQKPAPQEPSKEQSVVDARESKLQGLEELIQRRRTYLSERDRTWQGKVADTLGDSTDRLISQDPSSGVNPLVNLGAGIASSISRITGGLAASPKALEAFTNEVGLNEVDRQAFNQLAQDGHPGSLSDAQWDTLNRVPAAQNGPTGLPEETRSSLRASGRVELAGKIREALFGKETPEASTAWDLMTNATEARQEGAAIRQAFDASPIQDRSLQDSMADAFTRAGADTELARLQEGWKLVEEGDKEQGTALTAEAITRLTAMAAEIAPENKMALATYLAESLPEMAPFFFPGLGSAVGASMGGVRAQGTYEEGLQNFQKQTGEVYPSANQRQEMAGWAAGGAAVGVAGDKLLGGAVSKAAQSLKAPIKEAAEDASEILKKSLLGRTTQVVKETAEGVGAEALAEGFETFAEGQATLKPASAREIYDAMVIGGAIGGGVKGGVDIASGAADGVKALNSRAVDHLNARNRKDPEAFKAAVESNDVSRFLDPKDKLYDPVTAIQALHQHAQKEGVSEEVKKANLDQAAGILDSIIEERDTLQATLEERSPERIKQLSKISLPKLQAQMDAIPEADTERRGQMQALINATNETIEAGALSEREIKDLQKKVETLDRQIEQGTQDRNRILADKVQTLTPEAQAEQVELSNTDVSSAPPETVTRARQAAEQVIQLAMVAPERIDDATALALVENTKNALTPAERAVLRSMTESRQASNRLKDGDKVLDNILNGEARSKTSPGYLGINQHRDQIGKAIAAGSRKQADAQMAVLANFVQDHTAKEQAVLQALDRAAELGEMVSVRRLKDGGWEVNDTPFADDAARAANGGLNIRPDTAAKPNSLRAKMRLGVEALDALVAELNAAYDLKFNQADETSTSTPSNTVTESPEASSVEENSTEVQSTEQLQSSQLTPPSPSGEPNNTRENPVRANPEEDVAAANMEAALAAADDAQVDPESLASTPENPDPLPVAEASPVTATRAEPIEPGKLEAVSEDPQSDLHFQEQQLVAKSFAQVADKPGTNSVRPLVTVKNFATQLRRGMVNVYDFLGDAWQNLNQEDTEGNRTIDHFLEREREWAKDLARMVSPDNAKQRLYRYMDLMQFMVRERTEDGKKVAYLEDNVKTAISFAAFSWVAEQRGESIRNSKDKVNRLLRRDKDAYVSDAEMRRFGRGMTQTLLIDMLGGRAMDALGMRLNKDASRDLEAKMRVGLGAYAFQLMKDRGLIEPIKGNLTKAEQAELTSNPHMVLWGVTLDGKTLQPVAGSEVANIFMHAKGAQNILGDLFGAETERRAPSWKPITDLQKTAKRATQGIASSLQKTVDKANSVPRKLRSDMLTIMESFSDEHLDTIIGVEEVSTDTTHIDDRLGKLAANENKRHGLAVLREFAQEVRDRSEKGMLDVPFYIAEVVWRNGRVGYDSTINPQNDLIHRYALTHDAWKVKVDMTDAAQMDNFYLRVAEGFGQSTDKELAQTSIAEAKRIAEEPLVKEAVQSLARNLVGEDAGADFSDTEQSAIARAVQQGGEQVKTLDALLALAQMEAAKAAGESTFQTEIVTERDGVANGPILSHLLLGAAGSLGGLLRIGRMGGLFTKTDGVKQFNEAYAAGRVNDLYQHTVKAIHSRIQWRIGKDGKDSPIAQSLADFWAIGGELFKSDGKTVSSDARNRVKALLNPLFFGSGLDKAVTNMADSFLENYKRILVQSHLREDGSHVAAVHAMNRILSAQAGEDMVVFNPAASTKQLLNTPISSETQRAFRAYFMQTIGKEIKGAVKREFAPFLDKRDFLNQTARLSYTLYDATRSAVRERYIAELVRAGELDVNNANQPLRDLSVQEEETLNKRVAALVPILHTYYSKKDRALQGGIRLSKNDRQVSEKGIYKSEVKLTNAQGEADKLYVPGFEQVEQSPGVLGISASTHSFDSSASADSRFKDADTAPTVNIHDSSAGSLDRAAQDTVNFNEAFFRNMIEYSPLTEVADTLDRTIQGLVNLLKSDADVSDSVKRSVAQAITDQALQEALREDRDLENGPPSLETVQGYLEHTAQKARLYAYNADTLKLDFMALIEFVGQYASEGGSYTPTKEVRDAIAKAKSQLTSNVPEQTRTNLEALREALDTQLAAAHQRMVEEIEAQKADALKRLVADEDADLNPAPKKSKDSVAWNHYGNHEVAAFPNSHIIQLLRAGMKALPEGDPMRAHLATLWDAMISSNRSLQQAIHDTLPFKEGVEVMQALQSYYEAIPENVWSDTATVKRRSDVRNASPLEKFFHQNPVRSIGATIKTVESVLLAQDHAPHLRNFNRKVLQVLRKFHDPSVEVHYITPTTHPDLIEGGIPFSQPFGWYYESEDGKTKRIYIRSSDFSKSSVQPETVLHELVHAQVSRTIKQALASKKGEVYAAVQDLQALQATIREHFQHEPQVLQNWGFLLQDTETSLQEFVAYGMTSSEFQMEVLQKVTYSDEQVKSNKLVNAMRAFVNGLTRLFFKRTDVKPADTNGMAILIANVSGIMAAERAKVDVAAEAIQHAMQHPESKPQPDAQSMSSQEVLDALYEPGTISYGFQKHLSDIQQRIVDAFYGPFEAFKAEIQEGISVDPVQRYADAVASGDLPFVSKASQSGLKISAQEGFLMDQVEQTVRDVLTNRELRVSQAYKELVKLYKEARAKLKPKDFYTGADWASASKDEIDQANTTYSFIFKLEQSEDGTLDHLARFAAMGLANEQFNQLLQAPTEVRLEAEDTRSISRRLQDMFFGLLQWATEAITGTYAGQPANQKLEQLVEALVSTEAKARNRVESKASMIERMEHSVAEQGGLVAGQLAKFADSAFVENSNNSFVKAAGAAANMTANAFTGEVLKGVQAIRDTTRKDRNGLVMALSHYIYGFPDKVQALLRWGKRIEGDRKKVADAVARDLLDSYDLKEGEQFSDETKTAITQSFLRTGAFTLWDAFGKDTLGQMLRDPRQVNQKIQDMQATLKRAYPKYHAYFDKHAHALGHHLIEGGSRMDGMLLNTHNIARMLTDNRHKDALSDAQVAELTPQLDVLVSLYAMRYVKPGDKLRAAEVFEREAARTDKGNGVERTIMLHKEFLRESEERLFADQATMAMQFYLPEVYNPRIDVVTATADELSDLTARGYEVIGQTQKDLQDPDQEVKYLLKLRDGGMPARVSGVVSYRDTHLKGTAMNPVFGPANTHQAKQVLDAKQKSIGRAFVPDPGFQPSKESNRFLVPVFNPQGEVVDWRYMMTSTTKDTHLQRDHRFEHLLGKMAGQTFDKVAAPEHNREVVKFLHEYYKANYADRPESFREISLKTSNKQYREIYQLLPEKMKQDIREIHGQDALMVPNEMMDVLFGYREFTLYDAFQKEAHLRNRREQALVAALEIVLETLGRMKGMNAEEAERFSKQAGIKIRRGELMSQALVRAIKDNIVIKSIEVLAGNILSNVTVLMIEGVPMGQAIKDHYIAYRGALDYQRDFRELHRLQGMLDSDVLQGQDRAELERRVLELQDAINNNPVKDMIDDGLMPTIVDDVAMDQDRYSYQSLLEEKTQKYVDRIPKTVRNIGKQVFMTHDTQVYKLLTQLTQYSDFTARYSLRKHLMTRKLEPMTREDANLRASEAFVNYDVPLPRGLQYMDAMGMLMFFKYFLSVQRVLLRAMREHPVRGGMVVLGSEWLGGLPDVFESSALNRISYNPLKAGPLGYPESVLETGIIQGIGSAF